METILLAYDDSDAAKAAREWVVRFAAGRETDVMVVYAVSSIGEWELAAVQIDPDPIRHEYERRLREEWTEPLRKAGVAVRTRVLVGRRPAESILQCGREIDAAFIVVGMTSHGTLGELVSRNTAADVVHHAHRLPVMSIPAGWKPPGDR
jgi:nucleotide-binding universal stress UspA family protein